MAKMKSKKTSFLINSIQIPTKYQIIKSLESIQKPKKLFKKTILAQQQL